ncbi:S41 family peptidase [Chitinophaga qingshengii]|uniref:Tricorn protease homolog n=1 Tax=Chitinophaga qingshengii TaxID=1569794 RepID=A0ABR7TEZ4_9BACT|nr:S41 family peptidase [Chitinophaga qingshengii]MBC9928865.1 PD40 domain-containing protein [Chitinophaga qingshengii]
MKKNALLALACLLGAQTQAQVSASLFRYPDVSRTQIAFSYANDIWLVPKDGGTAVKITSPAGMEMFPRFSPDGSKLAFTGNYDGNMDVYVMPVTGGVPFRLTQHGGADVVIDWTQDGKQVLFSSKRESTKDRFSQFYTIPEAGGPATKLPLAYAEFGSYSPDGKSIAVTTRSQSARTWKRYRGGMKADIHIYHFDTRQSENISAKSEAGDEFPMWYNNYIYLLSDRGAEKRMNLWRYKTDSKTFEQVTHYTDYDVHTPAMGPTDIVYEAGGKLYTLSLESQQSKEVKINITTDVATLKPRMIKADKDILYADISPDGKRALIGARGDVFSLPAENGYVKDLTRTSGAAERDAAWSPNGKYIAWWSDKSGDYELWVAENGKEESAKQVTHLGPGFRYHVYWSPDNKKIACIDQNTRIHIIDVATGKATNVDKATRYSEGNLRVWKCSWSSDSRWLAYARDCENYHNAAFLYNVPNSQRHQITSDYYENNDPVFDPEGKYLYLLTNRSFKPIYSDLDNSFIYTNTTKVAAISLRKDVPPVTSTQNDEVTVSKDSAQSSPKKDDKKKDTEPKTSNEVKIDLDNMEARLYELPVEPGNYSRLMAVKGKVLYNNAPNTGAAEGPSTLKYFDLENREEKDIIKGAGQYQVSADGKKILVTGDRYAIIDLAANQKADKKLPLSEMTMLLDPAQEWKQLFSDAWRIERDFFYDPNMHGVNWNEVREKYGRILEGARTREEVNFVIGEMIGELNSSHAYVSGGDLETPKQINVGYLGVDWEADGKFYKIKHIVRGAEWDAEARAPLDEPGVNIPEGSYILAVNGIPLTTAAEPYNAFQGLANKAVEITYNARPSFDGAKTAVVKTIGNEYRLRHLAWIESNRKHVAEATNNQVGYIFVPSTGLDGQDELVRQFTAQWNKAALVIDERFNNGGQIPDRFIELLSRKPWAYWATRDGLPMPSSQMGNFGPKVMLINGWSGSGGDAFPDFFRQAGLGTLIGTRTWGGLIGISGTPSLIDGGEVTAPTFRMFRTNGTWFQEGHGVDPDIAVDENLGDMARGIDPQLERAITEIKSLMQTKGYKTPAQPAYEKR